MSTRQGLALYVLFSLVIAAGCDEGATESSEVVTGGANP